MSIDLDWYQDKQTEFMSFFTDIECPLCIATPPVKQTVWLFRYQTSVSWNRALPAKSPDNKPVCSPGLVAFFFTLIDERHYTFAARGVNFNQGIAMLR
jgi:hypothetical protein